MDLSLSTRTEGEQTVIEVGGEIDVYTAPKLREQLVDLVADGNYDLVVDMQRVAQPSQRMRRWSSARTGCARSSRAV